MELKKAVKIACECINRERRMLMVTKELGAEKRVEDLVEAARELQNMIYPKERGVE
jgi:type II secretory pathway predicted ATPase ExeA